MRDNHANVIYFKDRFNELMKPHRISLTYRGEELLAKRGWLNGGGYDIIGLFSTIQEAWKWSAGYLEGLDEGRHVGRDDREAEIEAFYPGYRNHSALISALHGLIAWADTKRGETEPAIITHSKAVAKEVQDAVDAQQESEPESSGVPNTEEDASDDGGGSNSGDVTVDDKFI